jgi:hypothetical protein
VQTRVGDDHALVDEASIPTQTQTRGSKRRGRAQTFSSCVLPSSLSTSAARKS